MKSLQTNGFHVRSLEYISVGKPFSCRIPKSATVISLHSWSSIDTEYNRTFVCNIQMSGAFTPIDHFFATFDVLGSGFSTDDLLSFCPHYWTLIGFQEACV